MGNEIKTPEAVTESERNTTDEISEVNNKFAFGAFMIEHWKTALYVIIPVLLTAGLILSGFTIQCGNDVIHKDSIKIKNPAGGNE